METKNNNFDYLIVGAGLSGLSLAKELSIRNKKVLLLEKGRTLDSAHFGSIIHATTFYDKASLARSRQGVPIYRSFGVGGTSIISCNNAVKPSDEYIMKLGIDIRQEIEEIEKDLNVNTVDFPVGRVSRKIMESANDLGYDMKIMPKFGAGAQCVGCGDCVLGCKYNAKWTALELLKQANNDNISTVSHFSVKNIEQDSGKAVGVTGRNGIKRKTYYADKIVLSAGGIGTPVILQRSGIDAGQNLFVDFFAQTYGEIENFKTIFRSPYVDCLYQI